MKERLWNGLGKIGKKQRVSAIRQKMRLLLTLDRVKLAVGVNILMSHLLSVHRLIEFKIQNSKFKVQTRAFPC